MLITTEPLRPVDRCFSEAKCQTNQQYSQKRRETRPVQLIRRISTRDGGYSYNVKSAVKGQMVVRCAIGMKDPFSSKKACVQKSKTHCENSQISSLKISNLHKVRFFFPIERMKKNERLKLLKSLNWRLEHSRTATWFLSARAFWNLYDSSSLSETPEIIWPLATLSTQPHTLLAAWALWYLEGTFPSLFVWPKDRFRWPVVGCHWDVCLKTICHEEWEDLLRRVISWEDLL